MLTMDVYHALPTRIKVRAFDDNEDFYESASTISGGASRRTAGSSPSSEVSTNSESTASSIPSQQSKTDKTKSTFGMLYGLAEGADDRFMFETPGGANPMWMQQMVDNNAMAYQISEAQSWAFQGDARHMMSPGSLGMMHGAAPFMRPPMFGMMQHP